MKKLHVVLALLTLCAAPAAAQHSSMPPGMSHEEHLRQLQKDQELKQRGTLAMGFDQDQTTHHFWLTGGGGAIVVTANAAGDTDNVSRVRSHMREIAAAFAAGTFDKPVATHAELPPGAAVMAANAALIQYRYEERDRGAAVVLTTADSATREAIHAFLRYQILEHKTGDPLTPKD
jgi:hypothetical protein